MRERRNTARLVQRGAEEREFDRAFWQEIPLEERLLLLWEMVLEVQHWKGKAAGQPRLQRSVLRIQRP